MTDQLKEQQNHGESPAQSSLAANKVQLDSPQVVEANRELRVLARLAWNNWPDNETSRRVIAEHEARDQISAAAWDRVIAALKALVHLRDASEKKAVSEADGPQRDMEANRG